MNTKIKAFEVTELQEIIIIGSTEIDDVKPGECPSTIISIHGAMRCSLPEGHDGKHENNVYNAFWDDKVICRDTSRDLK